MAWKNLKQKSLADAAIVEHAALQELDSLNEVELTRYLRALPLRT